MERKHIKEEDFDIESDAFLDRINKMQLNNDGSGDSNNYLLPTSKSAGEDGEIAVVTKPPVYEYNPELEADENPYYYEKNKMLYDLYVERMKRNNQ